MFSEKEEMMEKHTTKETKAAAKKIGEILIENHVPSQFIDYALKEQKVRKKPIGQILIEESLVNPEVFAKALSAQLDMGYFSIFTDTIQEGIDLNSEFVSENEIVPIRCDDKYIEVGLVNPTDMEKRDNVARYFKQAKNLQVVPFVISVETFQRYLESLYRISEQEIIKRLSGDISAHNLYKFREKASDNGYGDEDSEASKSEFAREGLRLLLKKAIIEKISDVHIEPTMEGGRIRLRKNGILSILISLNRLQYTRLSNLVRICANMNIVEKNLPQDGRIDGSFLNDNKYQQVDFRVSSIPNWGKSGHSDSTVIRVLDRRTSILPLAQLGMNSEVLNFLSHAKHKSHGIIIFTGPTGSGKTTTIYSTMATINTIERAVVTVEDPVEYRNYLWKQIQVNEKRGFTFAKALRSILRHDPDIIFVGEIRDPETAQIAFDLANTGHLVFSTLHANDSVKAIPRLINLGVTSAMIESACIGIVAQRLARTFCLCMGKGCQACNKTGYKGRTMISEHFPFRHNTYETLGLVLKGKIIDARKELSKIIPDMKADAEQKISGHITSQEEIDRVI